MSEEMVVLTRDEFEGLLQYAEFASEVLTRKPAIDHEIFMKQMQEKIREVAEPDVPWVVAVGNGAYVICIREGLTRNGKETFRWWFNRASDLLSWPELLEETRKIGLKIYLPGEEVQ